jgi:hypothetical protein
LAVPQNNNGHEPALLLGRHDFSGSASSLVDTVGGTVRVSQLTLADAWRSWSGFSSQIPHGFFFADAQYNVVMNIIYPINGTDGSEVLTSGGVQIPVDLQVSS